MTFAKKGHAERQKFAGMEMNQHSSKTLATNLHAITSFSPQHNANGPYIGITARVIPPNNYSPIRSIGSIDAMSKITGEDTSTTEEGVC
jgi:hypothetical protein